MLAGYHLDATREWTFSQQAMQVVDDQAVVDSGPCGTPPTSCFLRRLRTAARQALRRQAARKLMRLPLQEVLSDFDAITGIEAGAVSQAAYASTAHVFLWLGCPYSEACSSIPAMGGRGDKQWARWACGTYGKPLQSVLTVLSEPAHSVDHNTVAVRRSMKALISH